MDTDALCEPGKRAHAHWDCSSLVDARHDFALYSRADQEGHLQIAKLLLDAKAVSGQAPLRTG